MPNIVRRLLLAGPVVAVLAAPGAALAGPTVSVRIEGATQTLLEETTLTLNDEPSPAPANCPAHTAGAAIEQATAGNWDREQYTSTLLGETHMFANSDYWAEWVSEKFGAGICNDVLQTGDRLVMLVDVSPPPSYASTVFPLRLGGVPAKVSPGTPFTVDVTRYKSDSGTPGTSVPEPAAGATFTGASATTAADGKATITLTERGEHTLKATSGPERTQAAKVCVTDGADGFCGTTKPGDPAPAVPTTTVPCATTGNDGLCGTTDTRAPGGSIGSVKEQQRFAKGKGPRTLSGLATDAQGIRKVRLRLTRTDGGRCSTFDGERERFVVLTRCGATRGKWFDAGTSGSWSDLLPAALSRGRYVLDVEATDANGNVDAKLERGRNRIVFHVS
jgi:hypothetical protein